MERNLLANPNFEIAQQFGYASQVYPNSLRYVADQWFLTGNPGATVNFQISTDAPPGYATSALITVATPNAGPPGASDLLLFCQRFEGFQTGNFNFGDPSAAVLQYSGYVKASVAGVLPFHIRHNYAGPAASTYVRSIRVAAANVWQRYQFDIPGDPAHPTILDAANDVTIGFSLYSGSTDFAVGVGSWHTDTKHSYSRQWQLGLINGATVQFAGQRLVQLPASGAEQRRDFASEVLVAQRYLETSYDLNTAVGTFINNLGAAEVVTPSTNGVLPVRFKVQKRGTTTLTCYSTKSGTVGKVYDVTGDADVDAVAADVGQTGGVFTFTSTQYHQYRAHWMAAAQM